MSKPENPLVRISPHPAMMVFMQRITGQEVAVNPTQAGPSPGSSERPLPPPTPMPTPPKAIRPTPHPTAPPITPPPSQRFKSQPPAGYGRHDGRFFEMVDFFGAESVWDLADPQELAEFEARRPCKR